MRSWIGLFAACALALAGAIGTGPALAGTSEKPNPSRNARPAENRPSERGVVQSVSAARLVLKALDGSVLTTSIDARTHVLIDGRPASILAVRPGYVAVVAFRGASEQPALAVEAFTTSAGTSLPVAGVVRTVSVSALVLSGRGGTRVTVAADSVAQVFVDGRPAPFAALRPGFVAVVHPRAGELRDLHAFSPLRTKGARLYDGVVTRASGNTIVVQARNAGTRRVALGTKPAIFVDGKRASIVKIEAGDLVVVRTGPRREVWAFSVR